jgi:hypothetical protein
MHRTRTWILTTSLVVGAASAAFADDTMTPPAAAPAAPSATTQQLTIPKGGFVVDAFLVMNLSSGEALKPVSVSPDIWYGVTDDLTIGLVHSSVGSIGFVGEPGTSVCVTGTSNGCGGVYDNVGADVRYRLKSPWSIDGGLFVYNIADSAQLALKLGVSGRWKFGKLALEVQPSLLFYLTNRSSGGVDPTTMIVTSPATETLLVPVTATYAVAPKIELGVQTGVTLPFSDTSDSYSVPLSLLGRYQVNAKLSLGLAFSLFELISANSGVDARSLSLGGSYAL